MPIICYSIFKQPNVDTRYPYRVSRRRLRTMSNNLLIGQCVKLKFRDIKVTLNVAGPSVIVCLFLKALFKLGNVNAMANAFLAFSKYRLHNKFFL